jgi:multiple sugar transport system permease protein
MDFVIIWLLCGIVAAIIINSGFWASAVGLSFGLLGIGITIFGRASERKCANCKGLINKNDTECPHCHKLFYERMFFKKKPLYRRIMASWRSYLFIAPVVIIFVWWWIIPFIVSLALSFCTYDIFSPPKFVGLQNFKAVFTNPIFWLAMKNTAIYTVVTVLVGVTLSLILAVLLDQKIRLRNFFRTVYFLPSVTSAIAISVVWKWIYNPNQYGLLNYLLSLLSGGKISPINWLGDLKLILPSVMIMAIWGGIGYGMVIFLAGLQGISGSLYEAAEIDGANAFQRFWHITLPLLRPTTLFIIVWSVISGFQVFEQMYIMVRSIESIGGPLNVGLVVVAHLYEQGFERLRMGYASAVAYVLFAFIFILTIVNFKVFQPKD